MRINRMGRIYIIISITLAIVLCVVSLKSYSDTLRKEGINELLNTKNRTLAIKKLRLAEAIWPPLKMDKSYQMFYGVKNLEQKPAINIFLKDNSTNAEISDLMAELQMVEGVKEVKFISHQEALKIYTERNKDKPVLLELIQPNILPQSIEVYLNDFTIRDQIERTAKSKSFVDVIYQSI